MIEVMPKKARFDDLEATMEAALTGMGLVWLPTWLIQQSVAAGNLLHVLPDAPSLTTRSHAQRALQRRHPAAQCLRRFQSCQPGSRN